MLITISSLSSLARRGRAIGMLASLLVVATSRAGAQTANVLTRSGPVRGIPIDQFTPDLAIPDTVFECSHAELHRADILLPVDAVEYTASFPTRANEQMSLAIFVDSAGKVLRFAEHRGKPIRPDTRGLTPAQAAAAVQAAATESRSTFISVDYRSPRASVSNRGGGMQDVMSMGAPDVIANLAVLGKPGELAAHVVDVCSGRTTNSPR